MQVQDLSALVHRARLCGQQQQQPGELLASLQQELGWLAEDVRAALAELAHAAEQLGGELDGSSSSAAMDQGRALGSSESSSTTAAAAATAAGDDGDDTAGQDAQTDATAGAADSGDVEAPVADRSSCSAGSSNDGGGGGGAAADKVQADGHLQSDGDPELQHLLAQHPLAPEGLRQQLLAQSAALQQQHEQQQQAAEQGASQAAGGKYGEQRAAAY